MNKEACERCPLLVRVASWWWRNGDSTRVNEPVSHSGNGFFGGPRGGVRRVYREVHRGTCGGPGTPRPVLSPRSTYAQYDHDEGGDGEETDTE